VFKSKVKLSGDRIDDRLRPKEAAAIAHCSVGTIRNWHRAGHFRTWVVPATGSKSGLRYIHAPSFYAFLESQMEKASK